MDALTSSDHFPFFSALILNQQTRHLDIFRHTAIDGYCLIIESTAHLDVAGAPACAGEGGDGLGGAAGELQHVDDGRQVTLVGRRHGQGGGGGEEQGQSTTPA